MIKFFRHIRQTIIMENNKTSRYLKYAIGEIVLVVVGILIALSLNNWNTQRLNTNRNQELLVKLSQELDLNIERARRLDSTTENRGFANRYKYTDSLYSLLRHNMAKDHLDYMVYTSIFYVNTFNLNSSVFQELKNTGSLYSIGSDSLVTEIQKYYQLCDRESFYNINYSENLITLKARCLEGWYDFKYLYRGNPDEALKHHPWITNPRSQHYIKFRQFVGAARSHHRLMSSKLNRIIKESEKLKALITSENGLRQQS